MNNTINTLEYKGYFTKIYYSAKDQVLYGKIEGIRDLVNFESDSATTIEEEFHSAVDDYLLLCEELHQSPDKTYNGTFNVRIAPELHRLIARKAIENDCSLNHYVELAIKSYLDENKSIREDTMNATIDDVWSAINELTVNISNASCSSPMDEFGNGRFKLKVI